MFSIYIFLTYILPFNKAPAAYAAVFATSITLYSQSTPVYRSYHTHTQCKICMRKATAKTRQKKI